MSKAMIIGANLIVRFRLQKVSLYQLLKKIHSKLHKKLNIKILTILTLKAWR
jgi:hypothetical protein